MTYEAIQAATGWWTAAFVGVGVIISIAHTAGRKERARRRHPASRSGR